VYAEYKKVAENHPTLKPGKKAMNMRVLLKHKELCLYFLLSQYLLVTTTYLCQNNSVLHYTHTG
jgi:hypothetical protein